MDTVGGILQYLRGCSTVPFSLKTDHERLRPIDADNQVPDCSKFKGETGWEPQIAFEKTMGDLLSYWRAKVARGETPLQR